MAARQARLSGLFAALVLYSISAWADGVVIDHKEVGCVVAGKFPQFLARFDPAEGVARARVAFRPVGGSGWYSVPMRREGYNFVGLLPEPEKSLKKFEYYITVTDRSFNESRTQEFSPDVVSGPGGCQGNKVLASALVKAKSVLVSPPAGVANVAKVPAGFSSSGVIAGPPVGEASSAPGSAGSSATAAGAGAAGASAVAVAGGAAAGGGISTAVLVVGGVAVAGGAAAVAVKSHGSGDKPDNSIQSIDVTPFPRVYVPDGGSAQFTAVARNKAGAPLNAQPTFTWSTTSPCVQITQTGLATLHLSLGTGEQSAGIEVSGGGSGGHSSLALIGCTACPPPPP